MCKFAVRTTVQQEDIWAFAGLTELVQEIYEIGGEQADRTLAGKNRLRAAGVNGGYRYQGALGIWIEALMSR